ncbi:putative RNA methyltransferase R00878 [Aureimonas endophytica]|uniref:RNA methyltransferase R00878 n=1 Tax=Aureimonas endophytica TaxID=2027858 RepID=A0A916ZUJ6_9HYPH|nr:class I SAM-dependent RNA methyltransferase [Aureimonas endophytica]GGE14563.1 putative RNA methyltransferase R00878 [Aureimonas endophytica]
MVEDLTIASLGAKGDGVAEAEGSPVFVPFALPGETVRVAPRGQNRADPVEILAASPERQAPPCPHFGTCGGCDLQHASDGLYRRFKRDLVVEAFAMRGLAPEVGELVPCAPRSRRRAVFTAKRGPEGVAFGFHARQSESIVPIEVCHVVVPAIETRLGALRRLANLLVGRKDELRLTVAATETGLDIAAEGAAKIEETRRKEIVAFALKQDFARLSIGGEILVESRRPSLTLGAVTVEPPPGAFLQAVVSAEEAMAERVLAHLAGAKQVADLFAGLGTFALRLARKSAVRAFEAEAPALAALDRARRASPGLRPVAIERRDLFRRPVTERELAAFGGVVFDPPRAGAEAQSRQLAGSKVARIAAVSCNPATLARDCRILVDGGYRLLAVTPIDQFLWSHHVEAVALLER